MVNIEERINLSRHCTVCFVHTSNEIKKRNCNKTVSRKCSEKS